MWRILFIYDKTIYRSKYGFLDSPRERPHAGIGRPAKFAATTRARIIQFSATMNYSIDPGGRNDVRDTRFHRNNPSFLIYQHTSIAHQGSCSAAPQGLGPRYGIDGIPLFPLISGHLSQNLILGIFNAEPEWNTDRICPQCWQLINRPTELQSNVERVGTITL